LVGREGKAGVLPGGIADAADDDIGGHIQLQGGRDEVILLGSIGVDVEASRHPKLKFHWGGFATHRYRQSYRSHRHVPGTAVLSDGGSAECREEGQPDCQWIAHSRSPQNTGRFSLRAYDSLFAI